MIIRFIVKNIYSFKEQTEFNLLPSSKTENLPHHKIKRGNISFLRYSAIYGGNGVGKTNLIKAISLLEDIVVKGEIPNFDGVKFRIGGDKIAEPITLGVEFIVRQQTYFYTITFDKGQVLYEYLAKTIKDKNDRIIFERYYSEDGIHKIDFGNESITDSDKISYSKVISKYDVAINVLAQKFADEFGEIKLVYDWFDKDLAIIIPTTKVGGIAHIFDVKESIRFFANEFINNLNIGISDIKVRKQKVEKDNLPEKIQEALNSEGNHTFVERGNEQISFVKEEGEVYMKRVITSHNNTDFHLGEESDGTRRLFDYIPAIENIITDEKVYIIDEIERSIHPLLIKEIISKLALSENVKGQLIFTTHETNLLDQSILRPDEIWLTEKNKEGATEIYPLSDFKIHNTINIENGYLSGRYGGIPILSNLKDLKW